MNVWVSTRALADRLDLQSNPAKVILSGGFAGLFIMHLMFGVGLKGILGTLQFYCMSLQIINRIAFGNWDKQFHKDTGDDQYE